MSSPWWFRVPFVVVVVAGIVAALLFDRSAHETYESAVVSTDRWLRSRDSAERLEKLADNVDETVHEGFSSGDVAAYRPRLQTAEADFQRALIETRRLVLAQMPAPDADFAAATLQRASVSMHSIGVESHAIFTLVASGDRSAAAERIATLDREHAQLRRELDRIGDLVGAWQQREFAKQRRAVESLHRDALSIVALMFFVALGIAGVTHQRVRQSIRDHAVRKREDELQRMNAALENATIAIAFIAPSGSFEFVNRIFLSIMQCDSALLGKRWSECIHPDDRERMECSVAELREGEKIDWEVQMIRCDGSTVEVRIVIAPSYDARHRVAGHYWFFRDITEEKRRADAIRISEERFHLANRAMNDCVFDWDIRKHKAWVSEAWMHTFGHATIGDVEPKIWIDALHPDEAEAVITSVRGAIRSDQQTWSREYRLRRGDGRFAEVLTNAFIVRDDNGRALRIVGATMDITARKRAERAMTGQILNATADGIYVVDHTGVATFANQSAARLLGYSVDEMLGANMHSLIHHHHDDGSVYRYEDCPGHLTLATGTATKGDRETFWRRDGSSVPVEYNCNAIFGQHGEVTSAVVTFRDISERRAVERMKDEFVSIVSHELRTPLTAIRGSLGLLDGGLIGPMNEKAQHMLRVAVSNTDRLVRLINDILDMERMESGKVILNRQTCNAQTLMLQAVEAMKPIADKSNVSLRYGACNAEIFVDPDRITQTFTNLLGNAVKFSSPGSEVSLSANLRDRAVQFEVRDHGRGIPRDKLEAIFQRFEQVDASDSREKGGTGLGLAICRSIVNQHGGEIWAEDCDGDGARFRFTIPLGSLCAT